MASWEKTLRADTRGSVNNRPKYQDKPRKRLLMQGVLKSSGNLRPEGHTKTLIHEWETENTRTRQTVRLEITPRQSASKIHQKCFKCSHEIFDLTTAYTGRCCRKQYMCRRCFFQTDDAQYENFSTFRCCNQRISKQAFQIADFSSEMEPVPPKCDSCDQNTKTDFILPCLHTICSDCFEKETFVRNTEIHNTKQFFIGCSKHRSSKRLFPMQCVHKISFGKQSQYQGIACVDCAQLLEGDCFELECKHYACNSCCTFTCYCSICRKTSEKCKEKIVKVAGIQQDDLLNRQVTVEPEFMETDHTLFYDLCNSHSKIVVKITCGAALCIECIETMAGGELVEVVTGRSDDKEHCICHCSPVRGKHIISITSLKTAAFQIDHVKLWQYDKCSHTTCGQKRTSKEDEKASAGSPIHKKIQITSHVTPIVPKKGFNTPDHILMTSFSSDVCSGTQDLENPLTKTEERDLKEKHNLKREVSSRDKQSTTEKLEDRQTHSMSSSKSVMEEEDVNMLEKTLNEPVDTKPTTTASIVNYEIRGSDNSPTKVIQKIHCSSPGLNSLCSNTFCSKKAVVQFCDCNHCLCLDCMLKMLSKGEAGKKTCCGVGILSPCTTEIPMQSLKEYLKNIRKNPLSYIKEKTSARYCSQTSSCLKAVVEFRKCSHRMCMDCVIAKVSSRETLLCGVEFGYKSHCNTEIPTVIVEEYLHNYVDNNMERTLAENVKEVCDNPNCSAERSMKEDIRETLSCKHKLCVICVSTQTAKSNVIRCKVPTCTPSEIKPEILGIPNIGFTCYASCVLQVLGQTPGFKDMLSKYCRSSEENHMETLLKKLLENVNVGEESNYVLNWRLMEQLMARIFRIDESFRRYQENDCHSFIMSLLNALMKEETEKKKHAENAENTIGCDPDSDEETVTKNSRADTMDSCRSKEVVAPQRKKEKSSCPTTLFESRLTSLFTYNDCSHEENVDDQLFYSLLIPVREDVYSLENGLDVFFNREEFSQGALPCRECNACREKTITTRSLQMSEAPKILMLQLARFEEVSTVVDGYLKELRKTDHPVKFQMTLRVNRDYTIDKKELEYELYGVVLHRGSMLGGHYTSYVRKQHTNRWFYCSDSTVREIKEERIFQEGIARNAYVLFYSRKT